MYSQEHVYFTLTTSVTPLLKAANGATISVSYFTINDHHFGELSTSEILRVFDDHKYKEL